MSKYRSWRGSRRSLARHAGLSRSQRRFYMRRQRRLRNRHR